MVAQIRKNQWWQNFFAFLNAYDLKPTQLTKALNSIDSSRTYIYIEYRRLLESSKPWSSRELVLPENGFKTCYTVYFSKRPEILT